MRLPLTEKGTFQFDGFYLISALLLSKVLEFLCLWCQSCEPSIRSSKEALNNNEADVILGFIKSLLLLSKESVLTSMSDFDSTGTS